MVIWKGFSFLFYEGLVNDGQNAMFYSSILFEVDDRTLILLEYIMCELYNS